MQGLIDGLNAGVKSEDIVSIVNVRSIPFFPFLCQTHTITKLRFVQRVQYMHASSHKDDILLAPLCKARD